MYLLGDVGIEEELDLKGISYLGGPGDADYKVELKSGYAMPHDPDVTLSSNPLPFPSAFVQPFSQPSCPLPLSHLCCDVLSM